MTQKHVFSATVCTICGIGFLICVILTICFGDFEKTSVCPEYTIDPTINIGYTFDDLLDAIEWVESKGFVSVSGDCDVFIVNGYMEYENCKAIGAYQITEKYVDDVNMILSGTSSWSSDKRYTYESGEHYTLE